MQSNWQDKIKIGSHLSYKMESPNIAFGAADRLSSTRFLDRLYLLIMRSQQSKNKDYKVKFDCQIMLKQGVKGVKNQQ